jgi:hypothetical protein
VHRHEASAEDAVIDRTAAEPQIVELPARHHAVLLRRPPAGRRYRTRTAGPASSPDTTRYVPAAATRAA